MKEDVRKGMASFADGKKAKPRLFILYPEEKTNCKGDSWKTKWIEKVPGMIGAIKKPLKKDTVIKLQENLFPIWDIQDIKPESKKNASENKKEPLCTAPQDVFSGAVPLTKDNIQNATQLMLVTYQDACKSECNYGKNGITRYAMYVLYGKPEETKKGWKFSYPGKFSITLKAEKDGITVIEISEPSKLMPVRVTKNRKFKIGTFWTKVDTAKKKKDKKLPRKVKMPTAEDTAKIRAGSHYIPQMKF